MRKIIAENRTAMGNWVAKHAAAEIAKAIDDRGCATIVIATGASQFEVLGSLAKQPGVDWSVVTGFHLDEYIGLPASHPASFCRYLKERFVDLVPLRAFHYLHGDQAPKHVIESVGNQLSSVQIDVALVGIGENGHLAFNDPPADFETTDPYLIVDLDQECRMQQVGEGWFTSLDEVPEQAISMSIQQILKANKIFCSVPDIQKSEAVRKTLEGAIDPSVPASILRGHPDASLIIDQASASKLAKETMKSMECTT